MRGTRQARHPRIVVSFNLLVIFANAIQAASLASLTSSKAHTVNSTRVRRIAKASASLPLSFRTD
jgi:hypothetical protein